MQMLTPTESFSTRKGGSKPLDGVDYNQYEKCSSLNFSSK
jgi:hypothetical protein